MPRPAAGATSCLTTLRWYGRCNNWTPRDERHERSTRLTEGLPSCRRRHHATRTKSARPQTAKKEPAIPTERRVRHPPLVIPAVSKRESIFTPTFTPRECV